MVAAQPYQVVTIPHDLAQERGLTPDVISAFNVRKNGSGWLYDTKCMDSTIGTRWKSFWSTSEAAPPDERATWKKYYWYPDKKPDSARYFYPPQKSITKAIDDAWGTLWLVGGEIALMSMMSAGIENATCVFGDNTIPAEFKTDLKEWGVTCLRVIPDRDESGKEWAIKIRDILSNDVAPINIIIHELPYELLPKHGKDVNDYWLEEKNKTSVFLDKLMALPIWILPQKVAGEYKEFDVSGYPDSDLPSDFIRDIERALGIDQFKGNGWSKNLSCPFHEDKHFSAGWHHEKGILRCFAGCNGSGKGGVFLAKDVASHFGIELKGYAPPPKVKSEPKTETKKETPKVETAKPEVATLRPELPSTADLTPEQCLEAKQGRQWLDECIRWAMASCPLAPDIFHEAMALWLLAMISTRRMHVAIGGENIFPNLYIMIIAKTTLYHKSTALNHFRRLIKAARLEPLLLPIDVTPEALFDELAGIKPMNFESLPEDEKQNWLLGRAVAGQRSIIKDEASSILSSLRKDYNAGLSELLLQGYDGDTGTLRKLLKSKGLIIVKDMCLSFLGATTPVMFGKYISNEESENGFVARFAMITPEGVPEHRYPDERVEIPQSIISPLRKLFMEILPWHNGQTPAAPKMMGDVISPPIANVLLDPQALAHLNNYRKALGYDMLTDETVDESKAANYARLGTMAFKIAMLLAAIESQTPMIKIYPCHAYAAQLICERWRESLHRLDRDIARSGNTLQEKIAGYVKSSGQVGVTIRDITRDCAVKGSDARKCITDALNVLIDDGSMEDFDFKPDGKGRPSKRYRCVSKD